MKRQPKLGDRIRIFLDDKRDPSFIGWDSLSSRDNTFIVTVRSYNEFIDAIRIYRYLIEAISFDHDLGTEKTGYDCVSWFEKQCYFHNQVPPRVLMCHSMNPIGRNRIIQAIQSIYSRERQNVKKYADSNNSI